MISSETRVRIHDVRHTVTVAVVIARIANQIVVEVALIGVGHRRAIVLIVWNAVAVHVWQRKTPPVGLAGEDDTRNCDRNLVRSVG